MDPFAKVSSAAHSGAYGINNIPEPSLANLRAGNYKKGRCEIHGLRIAIETPQGQRRSGKEDGKPWSVICQAHYGYIEKTRGADGDELDVYIGPWPESGMAYVVNQAKPDGSGFDEHKILMAFPDSDSAVIAYRNSYEKPGPTEMGIVPCTIDQLKWWLKFGNHAIPLTSDQLPYDGTATMNDVTWDSAANPVNTTLPQLLYAMRRDDASDHLLLDAVTQADVLEASDGEAVLDALVVPLNRLERKMGQMQVIMRAASKAVRPGILQITPPFKQRGTTNVAAIFEMDDGQTVTAYFHNPDATPNKLTPDDEMVSWKWMLNKKDVTIVVAPERGQELNPREVARRIMRLVEANSARFQAANTRRTERMAGIEASKASVAAKQAKLDALGTEIATLEEQVEAKRAAPPAVLQQGAARSVYDQRLADVRDALGRMGWDVAPGRTDMKVTIDSSVYGINAVATEQTVRWYDTGSDRMWENDPGLTADQMAGKIDSELRSAIDAAKAKLARSGNPDEQAAADAALAMAAQVVAELGGTFESEQFSAPGTTGAWSYGKAEFGRHTIRIAASGGGVVQINGRPHDPDGNVITTPAQVRASILAITGDWKSVDPTTESGYRIVNDVGESALLYHQDQLDSFFNRRYIDIRNELRKLGWGDDGSKAMMSGPLKNGEYQLEPMIKTVGAGRNVVGISYQIKGVAGFFMSDTLSRTAEEMADSINRGLPQAATPTPPYNPDDMDAAVAYAAETRRLFNAGDVQAAWARYQADPNGGGYPNINPTFEQWSESMKASDGTITVNLETIKADFSAGKIAAAFNDYVENRKKIRQRERDINEFASWAFEQDQPELWNLPVKTVKGWSDEEYQAADYALVDWNFKSHSILLMAKRMGNSADVKEANDILNQHMKDGSISPGNSDRRQALIEMFLGKRDPENGTKVANPLDDARAYLGTVIDGTANLADSEVADKLSALYETHNGNPEFDALFAKAADAYQAFMVDAAKKAMGG